MIKEFMRNPIFYIIIAAVLITVNGFIVHWIYKHAHLVSAKYPLPTFHIDPVTHCQFVVDNDGNKTPHNGEDGKQVCVTADAAK